MWQPVQPGEGIDRGISIHNQAQADPASVGPWVWAEPGALSDDTRENRAVSPVAVRGRGELADESASAWQTRHGGRGGGIAC